MQAAGCAVTQCSHRSDISKSGIIPVLAILATSCQSSGSTDMKTSSPTHSHVLTAAHTELLQACISAGHYSYACQFTDAHPIYSVQPYQAKSFITAEQYLRYFYLLGMARLGLRRYHDAKVAFEMGITMPSHIISAVTVACKKKHLLVKCLLLDDEKDLMESQQNIYASYPEDYDAGPESTSDGTNRKEGAGGSTAGNLSKRKNTTIIFGQTSSSSSSKSSNTTESMKYKTWKDFVVYDIPKCTSPAVTQFFKAADNSSSSTEYPVGASHASTPMTGDMGAAEFYHPQSQTSQQQPSKSSQHFGLEAYYDLVNAFILDDYELFQKLKLSMETLLKFDGNWGLANQVQDQMYVPRRLYTLARLYQVIPLVKLAQKLGLSSPEEAEAVVRQFIMEQDNMNPHDAKDLGVKSTFEAQIDEEEGVVYFPLKDHSLDEYALKQQQHELTVRIQNCMVLAERMQELDITLTSSQKYNAVFKYRSSGAAGSSGSAAGGASGSGSGSMGGLSVAKGITELERAGGTF